MTLKDEQDERVNVFVGASNLEEASKQIAVLEKVISNANNNNNDIASPAKYKLEKKPISLKQVTRIWNRLNVVAN